MGEEKPRRLSERTVDYGLAVIDYCEGMPRNFSGRHVADQLLRSATSVAANYAEASEAESPADFIHKRRLALKELKGSRVWLLFGERIDPSRSVVALRQESRELMLMMSSGVATVQRRAQQG